MTDVGWEFRDDEDNDPYQWSSPQGEDSMTPLEALAELAASAKRRAENQ